MSYTGTLSKYKLPQVYMGFANWVKKITVKDWFKIGLKTKQKCDIKMIQYAA